MSPKSPISLVLWRFTDGKPGHEKQSLGLRDALGRAAHVRCIDIPATGGWANLWRWASGRFPAGRGLPAPDLLIGAGHATHLPLLAARRAYGGRAVVLMRPSLPVALFDLCLIPAHDAPVAHPGVVTTLGALNNLTARGGHSPQRGLILVGGPSAHFQWDSGEVARQVEELARARADMSWTLTTSRRTPGDFLAALRGEGIGIHPAEATPPGWLEARLGEAGEAWVTPDSVSMVYEALTAGCRVGLFSLAPSPGSRVARGVLDLRARGYVTDFRQTAGAPAAGAPPLNEAERCARLILERWFP